MDQSALERDVALFQRAPMLAACRDGPVSRSTIAERADCSRTTAYRATTDLEERSLVEQVDGGYRLTSLGTTMLDRVERFRAELDGTRHLRPVLEHIDARRLRENVHRFADATVMTADREAPYAIDQHIETIIGDTTERIYGASTSFGSPSTLTRTVDRVEAGVEFEWALPPAVLDQLDRQHGDLHAIVRARENTAVYAVETVSVELCLYDQTVVLTGFDDDSGTLAAVATTDDPDACEWARGVLQTYRERGERVD